MRANDPDNRTGGKERRVKERNVGGTVGIQLEIFFRLRAGGLIGTPVAHCS